MKWFAFVVVSTSLWLNAAGTAIAAPIRTLAGLTGVNVYEVTFANTSNPFAPNSSQLLNRLADALSAANNDFTYFSEEYYDVFYSTGNGTPDPDGSFVTIEAVWRGNVSAFGGSMNISHVALDFGGVLMDATFVSSFVMGSSCPLGCNPGSEATAVDGDPNSFPRFGGTSAVNLNERLRLTVGFAGISQDPAPTVPVPEPASLVLLGMGAIGVLRRLRRPAI